ncbi:MAG: NAD(P)H-dependent glycerol-3-phosphate dehydrogenase [Chloroflexota bacterium]
MSKVTIIGNTTWGNTLAGLISQRGADVVLWARTQGEVDGLGERGVRYGATCRIEEAMEGSKFVFLVVPSQTLRQNVERCCEHLERSMVLVSAAKGLERDTGKRMSEVVAEEVGSSLGGRICVLSGPNLAGEISRGLPAASMAAAEDIAIADMVRDLLLSPDFLVYSTDDVVGVELGGALKNIIALGAGMIDGVGLGDNAKGAFITWSWAEMVAIGVALGARHDTFHGLAGLGDLVATSVSNLSRNHYVGFELARGRSLEEIAASMTQVAEGVATTMAVHQLARRAGLDAPIAERIYRVLYQNEPVPRTLADFGVIAGVCSQPPVETRWSR